MSASTEQTNGVNTMSKVFLTLKVLTECLQGCQSVVYPGVPLARPSCVFIRSSVLQLYCRHTLTLVITDN